MTSDSRITEPSTCRRDAPIVRSVANSRVRWATVIEKVLKMTNAPTKSAIAAEREQEVAEDRRELAHLVRLLLRLRASRSRPRRRRAGRAAIAETRSSSETPSSRGDGDRVVLALAAEQLLRRGNREDDEADRRRGCRPRRTARRRRASNRALRLQRGDLDRVADLVALLVRRPRVDDDLVVGRGPAPLEEVERVEPGERRARCRCRTRASASPPSSPTRPPASGSSCCPRRGRSRSRARPRRRRARRRGATRRRAVGGGFSPSIEMSRPLPVTTASVPAYESTSRFVERALDRVREDVRAADHRDAEDDRDAGDRAELAPARPRARP